MEGPFLVKSLCSKLWNCAKRGCWIQQESRARGAETLRRKSDRVWAKGSSAQQWMILAECYIVSNIEPDMFDMTFYIERQCDLRYCIRYQYTISMCVCSISKSWNLDIGEPVINVRYRILVTFDIEQWDLGCRTPLILICDIEGGIRYRRSDTRYRGGKDPDEVWYELWYHRLDCDIVGVPVPLHTVM